MKSTIRLIIFAVVMYLSVGAVVAGQCRAQAEGAGSVQGSDHSAIGKAVKCGEFDKEMTIIGFVDNKPSYYRFTVSKLTKVGMAFSETTNRMYVALTTPSGQIIKNSNRIGYDASHFAPILLVPGTYYLHFRSHGNGTATPFIATITQP